MRLPLHDDLATAYVRTIKDVLALGEHIGGVQDASSVGSSFGLSDRPTLELRPYGFQVRDPRACLLFAGARQPNLPYAIGQWLWAMRGSDRVEEIAFYNGRGSAFSDDGETLRAAFGARMRAGADQLSAALELLRNDPNTRRAVVVLARPEDVLESSRDRSCAISIQFALRASRLECVTTMRSQSALLVMPYDAALFMTLHVWAAACLGVPCGTHTWIATSMHVYADEVSFAQAVLADPPRPLRLPETDQPERSLALLQRIEGLLREGVLRGDRKPAYEAVQGAASSLDLMHLAMCSILVADVANRFGDEALLRLARSTMPADWISEMTTTLTTGELAW